MVKSRLLEVYKSGVQLVRGEVHWTMSELLSSQAGHWNEVVNVSRIIKVSRGEKEC